MKKNTKKNEEIRLAKIAKDFSMGTGFNGRLEKYRIMTIKENLEDGEILDVGCADGYMAKEISKYFKHITAIDGSKELIQRAKKLDLPNVDFIYTLFEEYRPTRKFKSIILSDILEHIHNPLKLLLMAKEWVEDKGVIVILSPNANSLHRQIGVLANLIKDIHDLNPIDIKVGHRRVYDIDLLLKQVSKAGLKVKKSGGMFLKPLSNDQMDMLDDDIVDAFYEIGKKLPYKILAEIYVLCTK